MLSSPVSTDRHRDPPSVPSAASENRPFPRSLHKRVGSDEVKAVGTQFSEHSSYPDTLELGDDTTTTWPSNTEPIRVVSEPPVLHFRICSLDSYRAPVVTPPPLFTALHRAPYITQAGFDELQRQRGSKRKHTDSSGHSIERSESTVACACEHSPRTTIDNASTNGNAAESQSRTPLSDSHTPSHRSIDTEEQGDDDQGVIPRF